MKKIRSFSLFLALFLLFSFTSCETESGEITTEYISTVNTEVITQSPETEESKPAETEETTAAGINTDIIINITPKPETTEAPVVTTEPEPEITTEPEVTTVPEPETTTEPEVTTVPEPETTAEPEVTTVPEPETTTEPEVTTVPEPETTTEPEVTTVPEPETTTEPEVTTVPEPEITTEPEVTTVPEPEITTEPEVTTVPEPEITTEPEVTTVPEPEITAEPEVTTVPEPEATTEPDPGYSEHDLAPDFTVFDANGNPVRLSDMRGKPVVLNFWASWCPPCKAEMPDFDKVSRELDGEVVFMMVNVWDTQSAAEAIIDSMGYTFPVYFDLLEDAVGKYGIESIPQTFFIDKWGGLVAYGVGALGEEDLRYGISMIYN